MVSTGSRRWATGVGLLGGMAIAVMVGSGGEPVARADTPDDVIAQAIAQLNQGTLILDAAPTADLGARQADFLTGQEMLQTELQQPLTGIGMEQTDLSASAQSFLAGADEQWVSAAQNVVSADQAFVTADQAGDLSGNGFATVDWTVIDADLGLLSADFNVGADTILAFIDPDIGTLMPL